MNLNFIVNNQFLKKEIANLVVADSENYLIATFTFSEDWEGFAKTVKFKKGTNVYDVVLVNNSCVVPWEVIKTPSFYVSVSGVKNDVVITTNIATVPVKASGYVPGETPSPTAPSSRLIPEGGTEGQVLAKASNTDYDTEWVNQTGGGSSFNINSLTEENNLADSDYMPFYDTSASAQRKTLWSNIKAKLKAYFDTLYSAISHTHTKANITDFAHNHNDIYYTETEVNNLLNGKSDSSHNHSGVYQPTETGKGLSTNDYTTTEKNKLAGIEAGAEVNVNADWNAVSGDAQILNKPTIPSKTSDLTNDSGFLTSHQDISGKVDKVTGKGLSTEDFTTAEKTKLANAITEHQSLSAYRTSSAQDIIDNGKVDKETGKGLSTNDLTSALKSNYDTAYTHSQSAHAPSNAEANVQSDWNQTNTSADDYIKNKPTIPTIPTNLSSFTDDLGSSPTHTHSQYLTSHQDVTGKENTSNKVTSISSSSTDTQYPSAKCVYDAIGNIESLLGGI